MKKRRLPLLCCILFVLASLALRSQEIKIEGKPLNQVQLDSTQKTIEKLAAQFADTKEEKIQRLLNIPVENCVMQQGKLVVQLYFERFELTHKFKLAQLGFVSKKSHDNVVMGLIGKEKISLLFDIEGLLDVQVPGPVVTNSAGSIWSEVNTLRTMKAHVSSTDETQPEGTYGFGKALNQGIAAMKIEELRNDFALKGKGVKIGIISNSFNLLQGLDSDIANGELPGPGNPFGFEQPITILEEGSQDLVAGSAIDEGRGMAQLIHDIAPEAELFFHTGFVNTFLGFAMAIEELAAKGCNVIVDDISVIGTGSYQINEVSEVIAKLTQQGVIYLSSAGNYGDGSSSNIYRIHEREYIPSFVNLPFGPLILHQFDNGSFVVPIEIPAGKSTFRMDVQWSAPWGSRCEGCENSDGFSMNLLFLESDLSVFDFVAPQRSGDAQVSYERKEFNLEEPRTVFLTLATTSSFTYLPDRLLMIYYNRESSARINEEVSQQLFRNSPTILNNLNTKESIIVGASGWFNTKEGAEYFNTNFAGLNVSTGIVDSVAVPELPILSFKGAPSALFAADTGSPISTFSSIGGIGTYFDENGLPLMVNENGRPVPEFYAKPDIVGPDGTSTSFFGRTSNIPNNYFFGTSASAPNVAGLAALLYQASNYTYDNETIKQILIETAIDMDNPYDQGLQTSQDDSAFSTGFDFASGFGFVDAEKAFQQVLTDVGIKDITVQEICSEDVTVGRRWELVNPNGFGIDTRVSSNRGFQLPREDGFERLSRNFVLPTGTSHVLTDRSEFGYYTRFDVLANDKKFERWISAPIPSCHPEEEEPNDNTDVEVTDTEEELIPSVVLAPNPTTGLFLIKLNNLAGIDTQIDIYNFLGQLVYAKTTRPSTNSRNFMVPLFNQPKGTYIVKVTAGENEFTSQLIKQ